ncbi:MAG: DMT family transporter [Acidobacteria bacterium]|nr:DMT family transporter [Acidobacteriota bacterium]
MDLKIFFLTSLALVAFAFNSILCRLALAGGEADAASFTAVRLTSGALTLFFIWFAWRSVRVSKGISATPNDTPLLTRGLLQQGSWPSALLLFAYAICFSLAYLGLTAATGALILFGSVQLTMIAVSLVRGERPGVLEWTGLAAAVGGLVYLVIPGLESPPLASSLLMAAAGAAWGGYTLRGKGDGDPLSETTGNFIRSLPFVLLTVPFFLAELRITGAGVFLAVLSGAIASGVGYAIWYTALQSLTSTRAAVLQLSVPVIAGVLAFILLDEQMTLRLLFAALLILGGIAITIAGRKQTNAI